MSLPSREAIRDILAQHYTDVRITIVNDLADLERLVDRQPDFVFLGMKYVPGNPHTNGQPSPKIWLSQYLQDSNISYTGSDADAISLELNKHYAKERIIDKHLLTARFAVVKSDTDIAPDEIDLSYPMFVKPTSGGGGSGIDDDSLVYNFSQLRSKLVSLRLEDAGDVLIEEYLPGREFSVGILRNENGKGYAIMPIEIVAPVNQSGERFLSNLVKKYDTNLSSLISDSDMRQRVAMFGMAAFEALGAGDYGRIDIRLDAQGRPNFLEANLLPSLLNNYGNFPRTCLLNNDMSHEALILQIAKFAADRCVSANTSVTVPDYLPVYTT